MKNKHYIFPIIGAVIILAISSAIIWRSTPPAKSNVILIILDALRADHLGVNGYERDTSPVLDSFTRENLHFANNMTTSTWTPSAMASIFTGLYAATHGFMPPNDPARASKVAHFDSKLITMSEILKENGYQTAGISSNPWITKKFGFDQGFESYQYYHRVNAENINEAAYKTLEGLTKKGAPFFLYLHYMDPHNPYNPPAAYRDLYKGPLQAWNYLEKDQKKIGLYDGEIKYMDTKLGELFAYLKEKKLYNNTIIVIAADHGEQFREHGRQGHGYSLHNEELRTYLVIKGPGLKGKVDAVTSHIDILPTILDLIDIQSPPEIQGVSLISNLSYRKQHGILAEIRKKDFNFKSYIDPNGKKLIVEFDPSEEWLPEPSQAPLAANVFDSFKDYWEQSPLSDEALKTSLMTDFIELYAKARRVREENEVQNTEMDLDTINELKSLGYLGGSE